MTDRPDPRQLDPVTDAMVDAAAKELYEQWVSRDDETRMFALMWDSLGPSKSGWLQDARIALEAAAPAVAAKALRDALTAVLDLHRLNREDDGVCQGYTSSGYGYLDRWCVECSEQSGREYGTPYPCPTVAAITEALS